MTILEFYDREIAPRLDRMEVFSDLAPKRHHTYITCTCPGCGVAKSAFIRDTSFRLQCNRRNDCNHSVTMLEYLCGGSIPKGRELADMMKVLATSVGLKLPDREITQAQLDALREKAIERKQMEAVNANKTTDVSDEARRFLQARGLSVTDHEWGTDERDPRWQGRVLATVRDHAGNIEGWIGRSLRPEVEPKYMYSPGLAFASMGLLGLDVALKVKGVKEELGVTEGYFDVLALRQAGLAGFGATGGVGFDLDRLSVLGVLGVKRIVVMFDNDPAGRKAILSLVRTVATAPISARIPEVCVVDPAWYGNHKDPEALLRAEGPDAIRQLFKRKESCYRYYARALVESVDLTVDANRVKLLEDAINFDESVPESRRAFELEEFFWSEFFKLTDMNQDIVLAHRDAMRATANEKRQQHALNAIARGLPNVLAEDGLDAAKLFLAGKAEEVSRIAADHKRDPIRTMSQELDAHREKLKKWAGREYIGLTQKTIKTLDDALLGLRGFVMLAAQPNVGKTILAVQMAIDVLKAHQDACIVYISLDMPRGDLYTRVLCRAAQLGWNDFVLGSQRAATPDAPFSSRDTEAINEAYRALGGLTDRMVVLDAANCPYLTPTAILREQARLKERTGCTRVMIIVDYLQILPLPEELRETHRMPIEQDQWRIEAMKKLKDEIDGDPVFVISEARKRKQGQATWTEDLADIMGTARGSYSPDAVLLLNPFSDHELVQKLELLESGVLFPRRGDIDDMKDREIAKQAKAIRAVLEQEKKDFANLRVAKVRDGGIKCNIVLTNFWRKAQSLEGMQ